MTLGSSVTVRLALALAGFTAALPAQAQEELADLEGLLEEKVVTSASKTAETARAAPATSTTITAEQLRRYGIRTVDEAIRFLGVGATTNESQRQPDFGARGVLLHSDRNNHVLILVDGHRINEQVSAAGLIDRGLGVPIELIDHIEVILGPGSVLYGSSAMLGVINVVTKRAQEHEGLWVGAETEPLSLYRGNVGMGYVLGERAGLTLHLEAYRYQDSLDLPVVDDGLDGINGEPIIWGGEWENNEHQGFSAYSRLDLDALQLTLRTGLSERNNPHILFDNDNPDAGDQDRWLSLDARWSKVLSSEVELMARVYGDSTDTSLEQRASFPQFCLPGQLSGCDTSIEGKALSAGGELQTRFDWLADDSLKTLLGAQLLVRHVVFGVNIVDNETQANPGTAAFFDRVEQTLGVYAQHEVKLGADWVVNGGARFDTAPGFGSALSPRFAAAYSSWEGATFKVVYSRAFRGPNAAERGLEHPLLILKSQDLEAEKVTSVEGSYEQRLGSQRLLLNVFHTEWDNLLRLSRVSADVEAAFAFMYPTIGVKRDQRHLHLAFTTEVEPLEERDFTVIGTYRKRAVAREAFDALVRLFEWLGHRERAPERVPYTAWRRFRQIPSSVDEPLIQLLRGESLDLLEALIMLLVDKPAARRDGSEVQECLRTLKRFAGTEGARLRRLMALTGADYVPQEERDQAEIRAGFDGAVDD